MQCLHRHHGCGFVLSGAFLLMYHSCRLLLLMSQEMCRLVVSGALLKMGRGCRDALLQVMVGVGRTSGLLLPTTSAHPVGCCSRRLPPRAAMTAPWMTRHLCWALRHSKLQRLEDGWIAWDTLQGTVPIGKALAAADLLAAAQEGRRRSGAPRFQVV